MHAFGQVVRDVVVDLDRIMVVDGDPKVRCEDMPRLYRQRRRLLRIDEFENGEIMHVVVEVEAIVDGDTILVDGEVVRAVLLRSLEAERARAREHDEREQDIPEKYRRERGCAGYDAERPEPVGAALLERILLAVPLE